MQEFTQAPGPTPTASSTVEHLTGNAFRAPRATAVRRKRFDRWENVTFEQFHDDVRQLAKGLAASGVQPGDRVGIMSSTRYEWTLADYAIWYAGAVGVPIYETASAEQVEWILSDSGAVGVFLEDDRQRAVFDEVADQLPDVLVWVFEENTVEHLQEAGVVVGDDDLDARRDTLTSDSVATIVYTSGTTGRPKGCVLTHANLIFEAESVGRAMPELFTPEASTLLFMPLAHIFGRVIQLVSIYAGVQLGHSGNPEHLQPDLASFQPTFLLAVPKVFERIHHAAALQARASGQGRLFDLAVATAVDYGKRLDAGGPSVALRLRHAVFDQLVFGRLRDSLGGRVTYAISGGAALGERLGHFYRGIGITVLEGYGLTETSAAATMNRPSAFRIGTVGRSLPGSSVRISGDGEILIRGPHVFAGYWNNPAATAEALTPDGWLRTGDVGEVDTDGFLRITGRKKELIVTSGGKNVAPAPLEDRLRAHFLVSQCMVVGEGKPHVTALVTIDPQSLATWLSANGRPAATVEEMSDDQQLRAAIADAVRAANRSVSRAESIREFVIIAQEWTPAGGQLTPSLKLKRDVVCSEYEQQIESLYA